MRINEMRVSNGTTCLVIDAYSNSRSRSSAVLSVCLTLQYVRSGRAKTKDSFLDFSQEAIIRSQSTTVEA